MTVFEVYLNGKKITVAGIGLSGVLDTTIYWVSRDKPKGGKHHLRIGGLHNPTHENWEWIDQLVKPGDEVLVKIATADAADPPKTRSQFNATADLRRQKRYVRQMAKEWGWKIAAPKKTKKVAMRGKSPSKNGSK